MSQVISVKCPLGDDVLQFRSMSGDERLGAPFRYDVLLYSTNHDVDPNALLGQPMTVVVDLAGGAKRHFNGIVTSFRYTGTAGRYSKYLATLRPWLWLLTRAAKSRIFQEKAVPDIIKEVFREHGFSDFEQALGATYAPRQYCVQYRESDFNFVSRLMEHEGIYYYAEHSDGKHKLVLFDSQSVHDAVPGFEQLPYREPDADEADATPSFVSWSHTGTVQPGSYALRDYDYLKPNADLTVTSAVTNDFAHGTFEIYDYPGSYLETSVGEAKARARIEAMQVQRGLANGGHTAVALYTGARVELIGHHHRPMENGDYLIIAQRLELLGGTFESGESGEMRFQCDATLLDSKLPFVPERTTPVPVVQGPQTATIAGKGGQDVWTDEHGRVKLKFHWDREGAGDEQSSCWVRVSQNSASSGWGSMYIPHVGDEVIVDFLEGDPDQPIVTGRVYNANRMPPLTLPANDKKSIFRDHYGNELVFDGTAGSESISLHTPKKFSVLQLGKSVRTFTGSDEISYSLKTRISYTLGDSIAFTRGESLSMTRGRWLDVKFGVGGSVGLGTQVSVWAGVKLGYSAGLSFDVSRTSKLTYTKDNNWAASGGDLSVRSEKDILIDSQKSLYMTGGKNDNTLIVANDDGLTISFDPSNSGRDMTALSAKAMAIAGVATALAGAATGLGSWAYTDQVATSSERSDGTTRSMDAEIDQLVTSGMGDTATIAGAVLAAAAGPIVGKPAETPQPAHPSATSGLTLKDDAMTAHVGKGKETSLEMKKAEGLVVKTDKDIVLESKKQVIVEANAMLLVKSDGTEFKSPIKHKNFIVLN